MRHRAVSFAFAAACASLAMGCTELEDDPSAPGSSDVVMADWDGSVDFTVYSTYRFVTDPESSSSTVPLAVTRTRNAMRREFVEIDYVETDEPDEADLEIIILTQTESSTELELDCAPGFYWYGYAGGYNSCLYLNLSATQVTVGTILVGMGDASRSEIVFNGLMQGVANGQDIDARIDRAVGRLMDMYPADQTGS